MSWKLNKEFHTVTHKNFEELYTKFLVECYANNGNDVSVSIEALSKPKATAPIDAPCGVSRKIHAVNQQNTIASVKNFDSLSETTWSQAAYIGVNARNEQGQLVGQIELKSKSDSEFFTPITISVKDLTR